MRLYLVLIQSALVLAAAWILWSDPAWLNVSEWDRSAEERSMEYITDYFDNGKVKEEGWYIHGLKSDWWTAYHENGQIASQGQFDKGKATGFWKFFQADGSLESQGIMVEGERSGEWTFYDSNGAVREVKVF